MDMSGDYECFDIETDLSSCGGCVSTGAGQDCTAIDNVWNVACNKGQCQGKSLSLGRLLNVLTRPCSLHLCSGLQAVRGSQVLPSLLGPCVGCVNSARLYARSRRVDHREIQKHTSSHDRFTAHSLDINMASHPDAWTLGTLVATIARYQSDERALCFDFGSTHELFCLRSYVVWIYGLFIRYPTLLPAPCTIHSSFTCSTRDGVPEFPVWTSVVEDTEDAGG